MITKMYINALPIRSKTTVFHTLNIFMTISNRHHARQSPSSPGSVSDEVGTDIDGHGSTIYERFLHAVRALIRRRPGTPVFRRRPSGRWCLGVPFIESVVFLGVFIESVVFYAFS